MFHTIPTPMHRRMEFLEEIDARDRTDGTPHHLRLRQVNPDTGRFLALLAAAAPPGRCIEIGASAGYSTMWLALAAKETGATITTFEFNPAKEVLARQTFSEAGIDSQVEFILGDARDRLPHMNGISFCFLDAEKDLYRDCYDLVVPRLLTGGLLVADNVISHAPTLASLVQHARDDPRLDAVVVPIGKGLLLCRRSHHVA